MNKNLKRFLAAVLTIAMLAAQFVVPGFAVTKGDAGYCKICGEKGIVGNLLAQIEPTCEEGYDIYECDYVAVTTDKNGKEVRTPCDGTITVGVAPTGAHISDGVLVKGWDAECEKDGQKDYETCTVCEKYLDPQTLDAIDILIPKLGHDDVEVITDPECEADGYTTYTCNRCGRVAKNLKPTDHVDALDHDYSKVIPQQDATCRAEGHKQYTVCVRCGKENPEDPKVILPIEDHNLKWIDGEPATCTEDGYNEFKCEKTTCPCYNGVRETLKKLGHIVITNKAVAPTCLTAGNVEYYTCGRCDWQNTNKSSTTTSVADAALVVDALGHTKVTVKPVDPTCRTEGLINRIECDRCGFVHHEGEKVAALGHTWGTGSSNNKAYAAPTCEKTGTVASVRCTLCKKWFAAGTDAMAVDVEPLATTSIPKEGHIYETIKIEPTCSKQGYIVETCKKDDCDKGKEYTKSTAIEPLGHTLKVVAEVPAKCGVDGVKAHKECTVCGLLFALDTVDDKTNATAKPVTAAELTIKATPHYPEPVEQKNPTYNDPGHEKGFMCSICGALVNTNVLDELNEAVEFHYEIAGVNNAKEAVNSGSVTLKIYFDVLKDDVNDKKEYNSDVLANIFGVDFALAYDKDAFELAAVEVAPGVFTKAEFTPLKDANKNGEVKISQDMVTAPKVFRGEDNLFATLTFKVADDAAAATYDFTTTLLNVVHPEADEFVVDSAAIDTSIDVKKLGDANMDTVFTGHDTLEISKYIQGADLESEYVAEFDMDKDGDIDFIDLDLLRKAIVGNDEYLTIPE